MCPNRHVYPEQFPKLRVGELPFGAFTYSKVDFPLLSEAEPNLLD